MHFFIKVIHSLFNEFGIVIGVGCCWHVIREELGVREEDGVWRGLYILQSSLSKLQGPLAGHLCGERAAGLRGEGVHVDPKQTTSPLHR